MLNRILSIEKKRNRGHLTQATGNASQPGGPSTEEPADKNKYQVIFKQTLFLEIPESWEMRSSKMLEKTRAGAPLIVFSVN